MKEKVHTIHQIWDMSIIDGVADYKGYPHRFFSLGTEDNESGFFSDRYELIPLTPEIFFIVMQCWQYWLHWLDLSNIGIKVPHSNEYAKLRKEYTFSEISLDNVNFTQEEKEKAENNYQRELILDDYLSNTKPVPFQVRAEFSGTTDGTSKTENLFVEWTDLLDRKI